MTFTNAERLVILADLAVAFPGTFVHLTYGASAKPDEVKFRVTRADTPTVQVWYFEKSQAPTKKTSRNCTTEKILELIRDIYPKDATTYSKVTFTRAAKTEQYELYAAPAVSKATNAKVKNPKPKAKDTTTQASPKPKPEANSPKAPKPAKQTRKKIPPWTDVLVPIDDPNLL